MSAVMKKFSPKRVMLDPLCIPKVFPVIFKVQLKRWNISVRAINVRHFLPPHSCEPRPPYLWHPEPSASPPGATHSHCAETNCGSLRNFATICGEQRGDGSLTGVGLPRSIVASGETGSKAGAIHFKLCRGLWFFKLCWSGQRCGSGADDVATATEL